MVAWGITPIRENTPTITHIESRTHQNVNLQTLETLVARLGMHPGRCGDHIVAPQDKSQLGGTHGHAPTRESPIHIHTQQRQSFLCPPEFSRIAKNVGNHGSLAKELQKTYSDTDTHTHPIMYLLERTSTDSRNTNRSHAKDFPNLALWRPHHGGSKQQPTWRLKSSRETCWQYGGLAKKLQCGRTLRQ